MISDPCTHHEYFSPAQAEVLREFLGSNSAVTAVSEIADPVDHILLPVHRVAYPAPWTVRPYRYEWKVAHNGELWVSGRAYVVLEEASEIEI